MPAPGFALVFLTDDSLSESDEGPTATFSTTAYTKMHGTATIDPSVLATSNGEKGIADTLSGTSEGRRRSSALRSAQALPSLAAVLAGALMIGRLTLVMNPFILLFTILSAGLFLVVHTLAPALDFIYTHISPGIHHRYVHHV